VGKFDNKMAELTQIMRDSGKFYTYLGQVVVEEGAGELAQLSVLAGTKTIEPLAAFLLPNFFVCETCTTTKDGEESILQFPLPSKLVGVLLHRYMTRKCLPAASLG